MAVCFRVCARKVLRGAPLYRSEVFLSVLCAALTRFLGLLRKALGAGGGTLDVIEPKEQELLPMVLQK